MTAARDLQVVLGAGPAGTALAVELVRRGHPVRLVDRAAAGPALEGVDRFAADVATPEGARAAVGGAAVVYHCVNVAYHLQVEAMPRIQRAVLAAVEAEGARLVVLDTLYPYGETHGAVMTEDTPWNATTDKGVMRAELDARYLAAHTEGRLRVVLGRSADFVGPGVLNSTLGGAVFPAALTGERSRRSVTSTCRTATRTSVMSPQASRRWVRTRTVTAGSGTCPPPRRSPRAGSWR